MSLFYPLDSEATAYQQTAQSIASEVTAPAAAEVDAAARFPAESVAVLGERGLLGLCTPSEFGGQGQPPAVFAAVVEELARACGSTAMIYVMHIVASQALVASTSLTEKDALLRDVSAGRHLTTLAFSERGSRSQFWAPVSTFRQNGEHLHTTASKSWVTSANHAQSIVSSTQMAGAESPMQSTLYLLRLPGGGVSISGGFDGLGLRGNDSAPVELSDVAVHEGDMLTAQGEGAAMMLEVVLPWFAVGTSAMANGLCLAATGSTAKHLQASSFAHDGSRLCDLPNLRARLAEMNGRTEQSRAMLGCALRSMQTPDEQTPLLVLQARMAALEAAVDVTDLAMKACGGAAFSKHLGVERLFRDARAGWVMAPTVDHLRDFVGRALVGMPLF